MKTKKIITLIMVFIMALSLAACGSSDAGEAEKTELTVFVAASLEEAFAEIIPMFEARHENITVTYSADGSGTLMTQIQEGFECDIFFSAGAAQMDTLEKDGLLVEGSRADLLANQVVIISAKDSGTAVTGFNNISDASSIALAAESVPVGQYTRKALIAAGMMDSVEDVRTITTAQVAQALGGVEISECGSASVVKESVKEGSCEIGFVYYSDAYSVRDYVDIIEFVSADLTGSIVYPVARVINPAANDARNQAAEDLMAFLQTDAVAEIFESYMFVVN